MERGRACSPQLLPGCDLASEQPGGASIKQNQTILGSQEGTGISRGRRCLSLSLEGRGHQASSSFSPPPFLPPGSPSPSALFLIPTFPAASLPKNSSLASARPRKPLTGGTAQDLRGTPSGCTSGLQGKAEQIPAASPPRQLTPKSHLAPNLGSLQLPALPARNGAGGSRAELPSGHEATSGAWATCWSSSVSIPGVLLLLPALARGPPGVPVLSWAPGSAQSWSRGDYWWQGRAPGAVRAGTQSQGMGKGLCQRPLHQRHGTGAVVPLRAAGWGGPCTAQPPPGSATAPKNTSSDHPPALPRAQPFQSQTRGTQPWLPGVPVRLQPPTPRPHHPQGLAQPQGAWLPPP